MKRILLDTNIYGRITVDSQRNKLRDAIKLSRIIVYGNSVIRKELRATPKGIIDGINLRVDLLRLYQEITNNRELEVNKTELEITKHYYKTYRELGGITAINKMHNDFLIVASASTHNLDIVVSEDNATMLNEIAIRAYSVVNSVLKINVPRFIGYDQFKREIKM